MSDKKSHVGLNLRVTVLKVRLKHAGKECVVTRRIIHECHCTPLLGQIRLIRFFGVRITLNDVSESTKLLTARKETSIDRQSQMEVNVCLNSQRTQRSKMMIAAWLNIVKVVGTFMIAFSQISISYRVRQIISLYHVEHRCNS